MSKVNKSNKVAKMLSPEETALLQDIGAGIQQLLQLNAGQADTGEVAAPEVQMGLDEPKETEEEKAAAAKSNDGPTANEPAETRVEEPTDITDDSLTLVGKAIKVMLKEAGTPQQPEMAAKGIDIQTIINGVSKQLVPIISKVNTVEKAMETIVDALGFADAIVEEQPATPGTPVVKAMETTGMKPVASKDANQFIDMLTGSIAKALKDDRVEAAHEVMHDPNGIAKARENLRETMPILLNRK